MPVFRSFQFFSLLTGAVVVGLAGVSCVEEYDPPPEASLVQPEGGAFAVGEPVQLKFSEPVDPDTLAITIWPDRRDIENELEDDLEPLVDRCTPKSSPCKDLALVLAEDRESAELMFAPEGIGQAGVPMLLEVTPGLEDKQGRDTAASQFWAFQFRKEAGENKEPVEFDNGVYILVATIEQPIPTVLTLISDIQVAPSGAFALAGAEGDEIGDAPQNTRDPEKLMVDTTEMGWTAHTIGQITVDEDTGKRFLETEPFEILIGLGGSLSVELTGARLIGEVTKNSDGNDRIEATFAVEEFTLVNGSTRVPYDGLSNALLADFVPPEIAPEGHPTVCGDLCGAAGGTCNPPEDFPPEGICPEE